MKLIFLLTLISILSNSALGQSPGYGTIENCSLYDISPDGRILACSDEGRIEFYLNDGVRLTRKSGTPFEQGVELDDVKIASPGMAFVAFSDGTLKQIDIENGKVLQQRQFQTDDFGFERGLRSEISGESGKTIALARPEHEGTRVYFLSRKNLAEVSEKLFRGICKCKPCDNGWLVSNEDRIWKLSEDGGILQTVEASFGNTFAVLPSNDEKSILLVSNHWIKTLRLGDLLLTEVVSGELLRHGGTEFVFEKDAKWVVFSKGKIQAFPSLESVVVLGYSAPRFFLRNETTIESYVPQTKTRSLIFEGIARKSTVNLRSFPDLNCHLVEEVFSETADSSRRKLSFISYQIQLNGP